MNETCSDNRFEIIETAKKHILDATNIDTSPDEMKVLDNILYRCWQMGWLNTYKTMSMDDGCYVELFAVKDGTRYSTKIVSLKEMLSTMNHSLMDSIEKLW